MQRGCAFVLSALLLFFTSQITHAQVIYTFGTYSQNFDTLSQTGSNNPWVDNATLTGWYSTRTNYQASDGTGSTADLYSYGGGIINPPTDRALGSITGNSIPQIRYAVQILNNTGSTITNFNLSYFGEQWRNSGGGTANSLLFDYLITSSSSNQINATGYTADATLDFAALHVAKPATSLDGNDPANRTFLSDTITGLNWAPGQFLWLRWTDNKLVNNPNCGLSIDDLSFTSVPEPGVIASVGVLGLGIFAVRSLRRKTGQTPEEPEKSETASGENATVENPVAV